jgi:hypothetical protein
MLLAAALAAVPTTAVAQPRQFGLRVLEQGMHGRDVRVLQDFLTKAGFRTPVDGHFGPKTARRVRAWERAEQMPRVDGRVTRRDAQALRARVATAGGAQPTPPPAEQAPIEKATLAPDGTAVAPASAPEQVKAIIAAGNEIYDKPYKYGGGHGRWDDTGYDCSGSMSYALHGAGLLDEALDSSGFMSFGEAGRGRWVTTYGASGHSYMVVAGLRFDTSGAKERGSRWTDVRRSSSGYTVRHPPGL